MGKPAAPRRLADNEASAFLRSVRSSAQKLNLVAQTIRGKDAADALDELPPPVPPTSSLGHRTAPVESVIVTFSDLRPLTEEAVSCAMPRTAPGASASEALPSWIAAVAGEASSANRSSCGITICTFGFETPCTPLSVLATSPSNARW